MSAIILLHALVSSAVGVAHCHAGMTADEAREHHSRPHVHVHHPGHTHNHSRHHHRKTASTGLSAEGRRLEFDSPPAPVDHDDNAVYLDNTGSDLKQGTRVKLPVSQPTVLVATATELHQKGAGHSTARAPGDGPPRYRCNLVLRL